MVAVDQPRLIVQAVTSTPKGEHWEAAVESWETLVSDPGATFDQVVNMNGADIKPQVSWVPPLKW